MGAGDRNGRPDVVAAREVVAEGFADQVPPWVERYDLLRHRTIAGGPDGLDRRGIGEVGEVVMGERSRRNRQRAIDRIAAGMASDRIAMARIAQGRDHRPALGRGRRPHTNCGRSLIASIGDPFAVLNKLRSLHLPTSSYMTLTFARFHPVP